ncbi:MAG: HYR domain-containing protein, partial [Acidobacteria bacterium]|nr:HYR domain-containing protein [Acidobacteriota bacterium]
MVNDEGVDLYLYASDITFSDPHPEAGDTFFVSATIHNNSATHFTNVPVSVKDKYGPVGTLLLPSLPPHGTAAAVQGFRYDTAGYYTFRITVDPDRYIAEWNETNNSAARALEVGDIETPGRIRLIAGVTSPVAVQSRVTVSGRADYFDVADSLEPVSGAAITIDVQDVGRYTGLTRDNGSFVVYFRAPASVGTYPMTVSVTDFSLSTDTALTLSVVNCLDPRPDLICGFSLSKIPRIVNVDDATTITSLYVKNVRSDTARNFWLHLIKDGAIVDSAGPIAKLGPNEIYEPPEWQGLFLQFSGEGYHSLSCYADLRNTVAEATEDNNEHMVSFYLWCDNPDFTPELPYPQPAAFVGQPTTFWALIRNLGGIAIPDSWGQEAATSFDVRFRVTKDAFVAEQVNSHTVGAFLATVSTSFGLTFPDTGWYTVTVTADPNDAIFECNEDNNEITWQVYVQDPRPNLRIRYEDVLVSDPWANDDWDMVHLQARVHNTANGIATNVQVVFFVDGTQLGGTAVVASIAPYSHTTVSSTVSWTVDRGSCTITATADPANLIAETNEADNSATVPAVFELSPAYTGSCPPTALWPYWPMFDVCTATPGEPVKIYARARTTGAFNISGPVQVHFEDSAKGPLGTVSLYGFQSHRYNTPIDYMLYAFADSGWHKITATIDSDFQYPECNENNSHTEYIWVGALPDLTVRSEYIDPDPLNPDIGDSVEISVDVYNIGDAPADQVRVIFEIDGFALGDAIILDTIPPISSGVNYAGAVATVKWEATDIPTNMHVVRVITDPLNTIEEEDEDNNEATRAIIVGAAPDLWVKSADIVFSEYSGGIGTPMTITATIHNTGMGTADSAEIRFSYTDGPNVIPIGIVRVYVLPPADSADAAIEWIMAADSVDICVEIANVQPRDFDLTNNSACRLLKVDAGTACDLTITCPPDAVVTCGTPFDPSMTGAATAAGACPPIVIAHTDITVPGSCAQELTLVRTWTATDADGNRDSCVQMISVIDTTAPEITCPLPITVACASDVPAADTAIVSRSDHCDPNPRVTHVGDVTDSAGNPVTIARTYGVTDACGNSSECLQIITIQDVAPPVAQCPADVTVAADAGECTAVVEFAAIVSDNCSGASIACTPPSGSAFPMGTTQVLCVAADAAGNTDTCAFNVTVQDDQPPVAVCPGDTIVSSDPDTCGAIVDFDIQATDNCPGVSVSAAPAPGSFFPVGETTVQIIAVDSAGNTDTCIFAVTVIDTEQPVARCPGDTTITAEPGQCSVALLFQAEADDNCPGAAIICSPPSGSSFPVGQTTVTCVATDAAGNQDSCTFIVTVQDVEPPVAACPGDITLPNDPDSCGAVISFAIDATDNCPGVSVSAAPAPGSFFPVGETSVKVIATDSAGNTDTCNFIVTVNDTEAPVARCPGDTTIAADAGQCGAVVNFAAMATDNCPGATISCDSSTGAFFSVGMTPVTCIAVDVAGNADTCMFTVTVVDGEPPVAVCPGDTTVDNAPGACGAVVDFSADVSDNCPGAMVDCTLPSGSFFPV